MVALLDCLIAWLLDCLIAWLLDCLIAWLLDWMVEWLNDWMVEWLNDWMVEWLNDWLLDCLNAWMVECHFYPFFEKKMTWGIISSGIQSMVNGAFDFAMRFIWWNVLSFYLMMRFILIYLRLYSFQLRLLFKLYWFKVLLI